MLVLGKLSKIPKDITILIMGFGILLVFITFAQFLIPSEAIVAIASTTSIGGSHPVGIWVFIFMNAYAAIVFFMMTRTKPTASMASKILTKVMAIGAGMTVAHSFLYMCDMCSIPTYIVREGIEVLPKLGYTGWIWNHDIGFMRWMGVQLIVLYAYRKFINWKSLLWIIPLMLGLAFRTYFMFGRTGMQSFTGKPKATYFLLSYIITWYVFSWVITRFLKSSSQTSKLPYWRFFW